MEGGMALEGIARAPILSLRGATFVLWWQSVRACTMVTDIHYDHSTCILYYGQVGRTHENTII